ncbi:MAG: outer membrane beta-barrel protein, partial [Candidatus Angelobacter sp.]
MSFKRNGIRLALAIVLGRTQAATAQTAETPRFELGPEITQTYFPQNSVGVDYQAALGASFSANVNQHFGADGVVTFTPAATGTATNRAGGRLLQISAGVRAGFSKDRFRIYGKLRPGAVSFGSVITRIGPPPTSQFFR